VQNLPCNGAQAVNCDYPAAVAAAPCYPDPCGDCNPGRLPTTCSPLPLLKAAGCRSCHPGGPQRDRGSVVLLRVWDRGFLQWLTDTRTERERERDGIAHKENRNCLAINGRRGQKCQQLQALTDRIILMWTIRTVPNARTYVDRITVKTAIK
jgi:hypothetical protein